MLAEPFELLHSLGNLVVKSALNRRELPAGDFQKDFMTDAVLPAEGFDPNYQPDAGENVVYNQRLT